MSGEIVRQITRLQKGQLEPRTREVLKKNQHAWAHAISMTKGFDTVRAYWPMSAVAYAQPECIDVSGNGNHLQAAAALGNVDFGGDPNTLAPIAEFFGAANSYLFKADGGVANWADIGIGETYIRSVDPGLCLGGWFWWSALPSAFNELMSKGSVQQYDLILFNTNFVRFRVWPGGVFVQSAATINVGWNHIFGRYDQPSQTLYIYLNGIETIGGIGAAPAALADTAGAFAIGANSGGANLFTGYASDCVLCAAQNSSVKIKAHYEQTRSLYGV